MCLSLNGGSLRQKLTFNMPTNSSQHQLSLARILRRSKTLSLFDAMDILDCELVQMENSQLIRLLYPSAPWKNSIGYENSMQSKFPKLSRMASTIMHIWPATELRAGDGSGILR